MLGSIVLVILTVLSVTSFHRKIKEAGHGSDSCSTTNSNFEMDALNRRRNSLVAGAALVLFAIRLL